MSCLCDDWTISGCNRLWLTLTLTVILCIVLDSPRSLAIYHRSLAWIKHHLSSLFLNLAHHLESPPPPPSNDPVTIPFQPLDRVDSAISLSQDDKQRHTLYVCTKCTRKCPQPPSSPQDCRMGTGDAPLIDMEDLLPLPKPKTGQVLFSKLKERHAQRDAPTHDLDNLQIVPVNCLSSCDRGNAIAMGAHGKYTYQFGDLDETDAEQVNDVLLFTRQWVDSSDGFSKARTRPKRMRSNTLARVPPLQECLGNNKSC